VRCDIPKHGLERHHERSLPQGFDVDPEIVVDAMTRLGSDLDEWRDEIAAECEPRPWRSSSGGDGRAGAR
jgi:hypothetical protein